MKRIIFLSPDMSSYGGASYQQDVASHLERAASVYSFGPGRPGYRPGCSVQDLVEMAGFQPDAIIIGHAWLSDNPAMELDPHALQGLEETVIKKLFILNKEYTRLDEKLSWAKSKRVDILLSHHHDAAEYGRRIGTTGVFWPFAVDPSKVRPSQNRPIDLAFMGILQNGTRPGIQDDLRVRVLNRLFRTVLDIPYHKRANYRNMKLLFNVMPRNNLVRILASRLKLYVRYPDEEYFRIMGASKLFLNALSPLDLVSPRYFENMASRTVVFCESSPRYQGLFPDDTYVSFKNDLSDFDDKFNRVISDEEWRSNIVERAHTHVMNNHTWKHRIDQLLSFA